MAAGTIDIDAPPPVTDDVAGRKPAPRLYRIMIVEDEFLIAMTVEDALWQAGMAVTGVAATGDQALALAEADRPDLALMDIRLGKGWDGIETAIALRQRFDIPSIFTSANHDPENVARAAAARPVAWIPKPYSLDHLVKVVRATLEAASRNGRT